MTDDELRERLKAALPPVAGGEPDLWPRVAGRLEQRSRWHWADLALGMAALGVMAVFPGAIPWVLMHC
jgi:hypothetical protein